VIFDTAISETQDRTEQTFTRLPKGEAVTINLIPGEELELMLSKHPFRFINHGQGRLQDEVGNDYQLAEGKNIVGRDAVCNIVVDAAYRDVSRMHLIIEPLSPQIFEVTDLSSHGTFLPTSLLISET
ncbi:MAG: FHA domain-containing protein, partial [bacterium]|nr:FHA domain-containing protein [bacterium]